MENRIKITLNILSLILLLSSCATISTVSDDDVYVQNNPSLSETEELNDETSYENYKYNQERETNDIQYGFYPNTNIILMFGSPYAYHGYGSMYYSPHSPLFYNQFYNNYYGYTGYNSLGFYGYPNSYYGNYGNSYYGNPYNGGWCSIYGMPYGYQGAYYNGYNNGYYDGYYDGYYSGFYNNSYAHQNKIYKPRNSISGIYTGKRNSSTAGYVSGMAGRRGQQSSGIRNQHLGNNQTTTARHHTIRSVKSTKPLERGVAISKTGTRVSSTNSGTRVQKSNTNRNEITKIRDNSEPRGNSGGRINSSSNEKSSSRTNSSSSPRSGNQNNNKPSTGRRK
jgi:hypothetical protein